MKNKEHWENVYRSKPDTDLSWTQADPQTSLHLILEASRGRGRVIDIGGGSSILIDRLVEHPFTRLAVLDVAESALDRTRLRLGSRAEKVEWIAEDITTIDSIGQFDVWHDRAVFHFLTSDEDRNSYLRLARETLPANGHLILATFAPDGPSRCSDLDVCRYDARSLIAVVGPGFDVVEEFGEGHVTPWGSPQAFQYVRFQRAR